MNPASFRLPPAHLKKGCGCTSTDKTAPLKVSRVIKPQGYLLCVTRIFSESGFALFHTFKGKLA